MGEHGAVGAFCGVRLERLGFKRVPFIFRFQCRMIDPEEV